jgi:hypothetical protein
MKNKEKILNILLVRRPETENKWWDRLFSILLYGSAIIVAILAFFIVFSESNYTWISHPVTFSLEQDYQSVIGKEVVCKETVDTFSESNRLSFIIECPNADISYGDEQRYQNLYKTADKNLQKQYGLDKYDLSTCSAPTGSSSSSGLAPSEITCIRTIFANEEADPNYASYQNALAALLKAKVATDIHYGVIVSDILLWLLIIIITFLVWVVFWNSMVYRAILYVIYGKKITKKAV